MKFLLHQVLWWSYSKQFPPPNPLFSRSPLHGISASPCRKLHLSDNQQCIYCLLQSNFHDWSFKRYQSSVQLFYTSYDSFRGQISFLSMNQKLSLYHSLLSRCVSIQKVDKSHNTLLRISYNHTAQDQFCIMNQRNIMTHCATVLLLVWENRFFQLFQWLFHKSIIHKIKYQF